jgi:hypothetical protein
MADTWITDMRHFLGDDGKLPNMPGPALELALFQGAIVSWVTSPAGLDSSRTNVVSRRRPRRGRCATDIEAVLDEQGGILWHCPSCGDNGRISGWHGTPWDRGFVVSHDDAEGNT